MNKKNKLIFGMVLIAVTVLLVSVGSATYTRSVPQGVIPGLNVGSSGNLVGSDFSRELCNEAGQDFIIQIAPAGCESVPVRSDLLEENNVQVFCQLSATNLNPLIKVEAIEGITFSGDFPPEVTSVNFHPAKAALGIRGDLNSPIMENIGYVVINLRRQPNESAMPDFVEGNLTARIRYDIKEAFGVGDASFYLPEISSNEWNNKYKQYGFWDSRGYLRAEAIGNGEATVSIYSGSNNRLSGITLKDGETSNKLYLPGMGLCTANFQVKLKDIEAPDTRARLKINAEIVEVAEGARFLDNKCKVLDITKHGIIQRTELQCEEDNGDRENFNLIISPKVKLKIDGEIKVVGVGDRLPFSNDPSKSVFLGYVGIEDDSKNEEKLYFRLIQTPYHGGKLSEDMLNEVERFDTQSWKSQSGGSIRKSIAFAASETVTWLERFTKYLVVGTEISNVVKYEDGSESVYGSDVSILGFAEPTDEEFSNDKELQEIYSKSLADYNTVLGSYSGEKVLESEVELGEQAAYEKIRLLSFFNQKRASVELCEEFKLDYPSSNKDLEAYCNDKLTIANSDINNRQVLINGELKDITLTAVYEPSLDDYGVSITINNAGDYSGIFEMRKKERVAFSETEFIMLEELTTEYAKFDVSSVKESSGKEFFWKTNQLTIGLNDFQVVGQEEYRITLNQINLENVARVEVISNIDNVGSESSFKFKIGIEKRAIQLSPEKINSKIRKLEHNMKKLEGITNNLGEVVEAGKTACLVTGAALTFKNLVFNLKGKGIARQKVMRSTGGWYEICNNQVNSELSSSQEKCLLDNSETIESDVSAM